MKWFENLSTGSKLFLSFGSVLVILAVVMATSYSTINLLLKNNTVFLRHDLSLLNNLMTLRDNFSDSQSAYVLITVSNNQNDYGKFQKTVSSFQKANNDLLQTMILSEKDDLNLSPKLTEIQKLNDEIGLALDETILPLLNQGKIIEAQKIFIDTIHPKYDAAGNKTLALVENIRNKVALYLEHAEKQVDTVEMQFIILGSIVLLMVILFIFVLNHLIAKPLKEISNATRLISSGDLSAIELSSVGRKDEVGILAETFLLMRKKIHQMAMEISGIINFLETAVNEISAATSQLVASSSETATAITQTSTTIEEIKQTSRTANEKAKLISEATKKTNDISSSGNKAAKEMTDMTNQIQHQMQLIAESMLRLSEQGQAIGSIMTTVEDMAQQSNLLSVNASIEAAKAGDQGKGFAVVAQEVKSLANQSKLATNQVRDILGDIQKATSQAVMATEQGSKSVEMGVKKSEETSHSINSLVKTVTDSARDAMQIAATTHQQLVGMEQAADAMENIKTATFQNVEGSRQLEEAAKNLKELGAKLKELISQYKLE